MGAVAQRRDRDRPAARGFTLIEILVVAGDHRDRRERRRACLRRQRPRPREPGGAPVRRRARARCRARAGARRNARRVGEGTLAVLAARSGQRPLATARRRRQVLAAHTLPAPMRARADALQRTRVAADTIVPFRPTGRNEPFTFESRRATRGSSSPAIRSTASRWSLPGSMKRRRGFTLVEILVALAIVAIALTAGMRALTQATDSAAALKARTLALWVAQNRLAAAQIATPWPALGNYKRRREAGGREFVWQARSPPRRTRRFAGSRSSSPSRRRPTTRLRASRASSAIRSPGHEASCRARGFTLIEALLALAIFGVIAVLSYRATASMAEGEARLSAEAQRWRTLESLFTRFEADIRQAIPRGARAGAQREPAWVGTRSTARARLPSRARDRSSCRARRRRAAIRLSLERQHARARVLAAIDHEADGSRRSIRSSAASPDSTSSTSRARAVAQPLAAAWRGRPPRAVKLTLTLDDGSRIDRFFSLR